MTQVLHPVQERITALDVLRGFALFGVLLVNMADFSSSALGTDALVMRGSPLDQVLNAALIFFAVTKFYLLFSFLFGVGFAVQMRRAASHGRAFAGIYLRRLIVLLGIGFAHAILLWSGDILRLYAVAGLMLLLVRHLPDRFLIGLALVIAAASLILFGVFGEGDPVHTSLSSDTIALYTSGSYSDLVAFRATQQHAVFNLHIPMVPVMFLFGLVVGRNGWLDQKERYAPFLRRWWKWALLVGLIGSALLVAGFSGENPWLLSVGVSAGAPALSFVYASAVLLHAERLRWLAPVGQMALSNYLTHSLICTTLFYGYGFGFYDQLSTMWTTLLVVSIFAAQIAWSAWWMQHYRFGLAEWLWRTLSYWQIQPMRRPP
ncbi:MAG: DUF418 domain-containing protein [Anaerolineae bacterium]|nr:DUF418 domain-containing protein [Anaerolineae bacterium]